MLKIPRTVKLNNLNVLKVANTQRINQKKCHHFLATLREERNMNMWQQKKNLWKKREIQQEKILDSIYLWWHGKLPAHELKHAVGDRKMWRCMITQASRQDIWWCLWWYLFKRTAMALLFSTMKLFCTLTSDKQIFHTLKQIFHLQKV